MPPKCQYVQLSDREHILERPETYIGDSSVVNVNELIYEEGKFIRKNIKCNYGLYKIFDEVLVNAADAASNNPNAKNVLYITISEDGTILVKNTGVGISIEKSVTAEGKSVYNPEFIFGMLRTSDNYDDTKKRVTGGRNGLGAKLTNIMSTKFSVETSDGKNVYKKTWIDNMKTSTPEDIKKAKKSTIPYVSIEFIPDYPRFQVTLEDMSGLFIKRIFDIAGTSSFDEVYFNENKLPIKTFHDLVKLFETDLINLGCSSKYNWSAFVSFNSKIGSMSYVNNIYTSKNGIHHDHISSIIKESLGRKYHNEKYNDAIKKTFKNIHLFINATAINPHFSSQTKERLTKTEELFECTLDSKSLKTIKDVVEKMIDDTYEQSQMKEIAKETKITKENGGKLIDIDDFEDANYAGKKPKDCILMLLEGKSALGSCKAGLSALSQEERSYYGFFPLRGKPLNVSDMKIDAIKNNKEIMNIARILGLSFGSKDFSKLRYGNIIIGTDADSVLPDTPLMLKNTKGEIEIRTIDDIATNFAQENEVHGILNCVSMKEYGELSEPYMVWSSVGWTPINKVFRHKISKKMYRVLTHTGCLDVTEDHCLLNNNLEKISAKDLNIGDEIYHNDLNINDTITNNYNISEDEAFIMGLFFADGTCGVYNRKPKIINGRDYTFNRTRYGWSIVNTDIEHLQNIKNKMEEIYTDLKFKILTRKYKKTIIYKLTINSGIETKQLVEKYSELFYDKDKNKKVPVEILNSTYENKVKFFEGFYLGNGGKNKLEKCEVIENEEFVFNGKIGSLGMYYLCTSIGYNVSINLDENVPEIYKLTIGKCGLNENPNAIKKIIELPQLNDEYVYDLETEIHNFQAGVGRLVPSNCDGSHIKGLLLNLFHAFWPDLLKMDIIKDFKTPIVKLTEKGVTTEFLSLKEFREFVPRTVNPKVKYYKGLGTSSNEEFQDYFRNLDTYMKNFISSNNDSEKFSLAFDSKRADDRKEWINNYLSKDESDFDDSINTIEEFFDRDLASYSAYVTLHRAIPSIVDGFKPSQRKIFFTCVKSNINSEIKVAQLAGKVSQDSSYHHGEKSLEEAIVKMAQNFTGTNNIPLLAPKGSFGTREIDQASASRYIYTHLESIVDKIFIKDDENILNYLKDEGDSIEPEFYLPIIPMLLVNGSKGLATGFSTFIPNYNPYDIIDYLIARLTKKPVKPLVPWFRGYKGSIVPNDNNGFIINGIVKYLKEKKDWINVSEISCNSKSFNDFVSDFKEYLKKNKELESCCCTGEYENHNTMNEINVNIKIERHKIEADKAFQSLLTKYTQESISLNNMTVIDEDKTIKKYDSAESICDTFVNFRLKYYQKRKDYIIDRLNKDIRKLENIIEFVKQINCEDDTRFDLKKKTKSDLIYMLYERNFTKLSDIENNTDEHSDRILSSDYDYLLELSVVQLASSDKYEERAKNLKQKLDHTIKSTTVNMWLEELKTLLLAMGDSYKNIATTKELKKKTK